MTVKIDYNELKNAAKEINDACNTSIKVVAVKRDHLAKEVYDFVKNSNGTAPESVLSFYNEKLAPYIEGAVSTEAAPADAEQDVTYVCEDQSKEPEKDAGPETTKLGNDFDVLKAHAGTLGVEVVEGLSLSGLEKLIFDTLDNLSDDEWLALPKEITEWDKKMGELVTAQKKEKKRQSEKDEDSGDDKKAKVSRDPKEPRPDFKFSEGTSSFQIMEVFATLFKNSKGEGVKIADLKDACEKAKVKSSNVGGRVAATINYASLPEGGEQVFRHNGLLFPKGHVIQDAKE